MKSFKLTVLAAAMALILAPGASALAEGFYVTPKLGYSHMKAKGSGASPGPGWEEVFGSGSVSKGGALFGLAFGYDFKQAYDVPLRAEFEYAYRGNREMSKGSVAGFQAAPGITADGDWKEKVGAQSFFVNGYFDIHNSSPVTPYIGVGLGLARVSAESHMGVRNIAGAVPPVDDFELNHSRTKANFAWNIGAGAAWAINDFMSLDLGYRYADFGKVNLNQDYLVQTDTDDFYFPATDVKVTAHEVMLGVRFSF